MEGSEIAIVVEWFVRILDIDHAQDLNYPSAPGARRTPTNVVRKDSSPAASAGYPPIS